MSFINELKRRNVFKVGAAYVVMAWLAAQGVDVFLENFGAPDWVIKTVLLLLVAGLPFALFFAWAFELTPEGIKKERDVDRSQSITNETGRKLDFAVIGILLVALTWFAWDKFAAPTSPDVEGRLAAESGPKEFVGGRSAADQDLNRAQSALPQNNNTQKTIAVLPFVNMSSDPEQEYFSDGITEEILNSLAKVKDLQVSGRTSSFAFKGQNQNLGEIGETLGVDHILEGSVRKSGNTVRITAQLIRVDNGFHLWSETYDRELDNVFAIQDEIANAILLELKLALLAGEESAPKVARTNSEAYDLYLLARQRLYERTVPSVASAAELLDKAIASDTNYAPAYAQRGIAALLMAEGSGSYGTTPLKQAQAEGKLYLDKALSIDPELAEAWAGMGLYHAGYPGGTREAIQSLEHALELNPGLIDASNWLNNALQAEGRPGEARQVVSEMIKRDPLYRPGIGNAVISYTNFGEPEKALQYLERIEKQIPHSNITQLFNAYVRLGMGNYVGAQEYTDKILAVSPTQSSARMVKGWALVSLHQFEEAIKHNEPSTKVTALTALGRFEEAGMIASRLAEDRADVATLFTFLNMADRSQELVSYLEERWPDLESLQIDFPSYGGDGYILMMDVALAYSRTGNAERFDDAMTRLNSVHERLLAEGISNNNFFMVEASRLSLAGDRSGSLDFLGRAINQGYITSGRISQEFPALAPLESEPEFEAIQTTMYEHLNSERAQLGLEPVST